MQTELVERARQGDQQAFSALAAAHVDRCYALAFRILRDPHRAQDATQTGAHRGMAGPARCSGSRTLRRLAPPPGRPRLLR